MGLVHNRPALDGHAVVQDYEQERGAAVTFRGHAVLRYEPAGDEYVLHWFDSMGMPPNEFRGRFEGNVLTLHCPMPQGQSRAVFDFRGADRLGATGGEHRESTSAGSRECSVVLLSAGQRATGDGLHRRARVPISKAEDRVDVLPEARWRTKRAGCRDSALRHWWLRSASPPVAPGRVMGSALRTADTAVAPDPTKNAPAWVGEADHPPKPLGHPSGSASDAAGGVAVLLF